MPFLTDQEHQDLLAAARERDRLQALINTPELVNFRDAVLLEALHQRERWGSDHDEGKTPANWYWLVAHLASRALSHAHEWERLRGLTQDRAVRRGYMHTAALHHRDKAVHHCITTAAAIGNWHAYMLDLTNMRPGIATPAEVARERFARERFARDVGLKP